MNLEYHNPVLLEETVESLNIKPNGTYLDLTFGGGGHSKKIIEKLTEKGRLIAFDQDFDANRNLLENDNFFLINSNFKFFDNFLKVLKIKKVDGIVADLGISSYQIDKPSRGFSYINSEMLDMRMNYKSKKTAVDIINNYSFRELLNIFRKYGELKNAKTLTSKIIKHRENTYIKTNKDLINILYKKSQKPCFKTLSKLYQAIRIEINEELKSLEVFLEKVCFYLNSKSRIAIISYHSLEDRLVKNFFKSNNHQGILNKDLYGNIICPYKTITKRPIVASELEKIENKRARSAKLRVAEKL